MDFSQDSQDPGKDLVPQNKHLVIADRLEDVAVLIGEPLEKEVTLGTGEKVTPGLGMDSGAKALSEQAVKLRKGSFVVPVIGIACAGKTTLVNTLLDTDLETHPDICSGVLTHVVYGQNTDTAKVFYTDDTPPQTMSLEAFKDFSSLNRYDIDESSGDDPFLLPEQLRNVRHAVVESASPLSAKGITFVDTLGYNAGVMAEKTTSDILDGADAIIIVLRDRPPIAENEADILRNRLRDLTGKAKHFLFVLNDSGLYDKEKADLLARTPHVLARVLGISVEDIDGRLLITNARQAGSAKQTEDSQVLEAHGLPAVERAIEARLLNQTEELQREAAVRILAPHYLDARATVSNQVSMLRKDIESIEKTIFSLEEKLGPATEKVEGVVHQLTDGVQRLTETITSSFNSYFAEEDRGWLGNMWETVRKRYKPSSAEKELLEAWEELDPKIGFFKLAKAMIPLGNHEARKAKLMKLLKPPVKEFTDFVIGRWTKQLPGELKEDLEKLETDLKESTSDLVKYLDNLDQTIREMLEVPIDATRRDRNFERILHTILGILTGDINQMIGSVYNPNWTGALMRVIIHVSIGMIGGLVFGPLGILLPVLESIVVFILDRKHGRESFGQMIANKLHQALRDNATEIQADIKRQLVDHFEPKIRGVSDDLMREVNSSQKELTRTRDILKQRKEAREMARLKDIDARLTTQWEAVSNLVYERVLTDAELQKLLDQ